MIEFELDRKDVRELERILQRFKGDEIVRCIIRATNRAAVHARKVGLKEIGKVYAIKPNQVRKQAVIRDEMLGTTIHVKGHMIPIADGSTDGMVRYKGKVQPKGIFVQVKKGSGSLVPRSFDYGGRFFARTSKKRFPIKGLYGPSVPQLFGNPDVVEAMEEAGMDMYEKRLEHELDRLIGG